MVILRSHKIVFGIIFIAALIRAEAQNDPAKSDESWTANTQTASENTSPVRTIENYTKVGDRTIHKTSTEVLGPGGEYQPYSDTETEIVQDGANTSHSIVRSYTFGPGGERQLVRVMEQKKQELPSGDVRVVRTMLNPDEFGNLHPVQREFVDTKRSGTNSEETQSAVYTTDGSGALVATGKIREEKRQSADGGIETVRTTSAPDLNGNWQVTERVQGTEKTDGQNRTTEQVVLRPDYESKLSEVSHTATTESQADGQKSETTQTYSVNLPGVAPDGSMHLVARTTTLRTKKPDGTTTEQQIEQRDPLDGKLKTMVTISNHSIALASGSSGTTTTSVRGFEGGFSIVSSETKQSSQIPMQVQVSPADQKSGSPEK